MQLHRGNAATAWQRPSPRQRLGALGLTVLVELAVLLLVLAFGGEKLRERIVSAAPTSIVFVPNAAPAPAPQRQQQRAKEKAKPPAPKPQRPLPVSPPVPRAELPFIPMSRSDLAASDISRLGTAANPGAASAAQATSAAAVGEGPGGVTLYNAEWVHEPSDAELRTYLPPRVDQGSWALIACQTMAHNQVENCAQLGESPRGSGLSKAMRLAAWQFRVRPPRIDGKPMVGAWVRIRIDFSKGKGTE
jgi:protein TonB